MKKLSENQRQSIRSEVMALYERVQSQSSVAKMAGLSAGYINDIIKNKFEQVSDEKLLKAQLSIRRHNPTDWRICGTTVMNDLHCIFADAQQNRKVFWFIGAAGCGKTISAKEYARTGRHVVYVSMGADMSRTNFMSALASAYTQATGRRMDETRPYEIRMELGKNIAQLRDVLIVIDEADKMKNEILYLLISLYNDIENLCGIVFLSTVAGRDKIIKGKNAHRKGYEEFYSRLGGVIPDIKPNCETDIYNVCIENGMTDSEYRQYKDEFKLFNYDLRRVDRVLSKVKGMASIEVQ